MPTTDVRGHSVPLAGEHPSRSAWLLAPLLSVKDPIPVASTAARATKVTDLASAGITPSTSNPIFFARADAGAGRELEYTTDGTTFRTVTATPVTPWGMAAGQYTFTTTAVTVMSQVISLPAGRFAVSPRMTANISTPVGGSAAMTVRAMATSSTSFTLYLYSATGATFAAGLSIPVDWTAVQMTATTADG